MKLGKRSCYWLLGLVSFALLFILSQAMPAQAATNYDAKDYTTSASVLNGPDYKHADTVQIEYNLAFGDKALHAGDTITVDLPENLRAKTVGDVFDVTDEETGQVIGTGKVTTDGKVVLTLNENVEGKTNTEIQLNLATKYRYEDTGEKDVVFNLENGGSSNSVINIVSDEANLSKKGTMDVENGRIKWTILVNRQELKMEGLSIADTIGDKQSMIEGVEVYNGKWSSQTTYKRTDKINEDAYNVKYTDNGFNLDFNDTVNNLIVIDYYTKVTEPELMNSGYHFKNQAIMEWGGGTDGERNKEEANGKVYDKSENSGSGGGTSSSSSSSSSISSSSSSASSSSSSSVSSSSSSASSSSSSSVSSSSSSVSSSSSSSVSSSSSSASSSSSSSVSSSSSSVASSSSSSDNSASSSSSNVTSTPDENSNSNGGTDTDTSVTEPDNPEDNTNPNPDIDEDTGTIDVDGGFENGTGAATSSSSQPVAGQAPAQSSSTPATKKSSAKTTVTQADAATPTTQSRGKLPQTSESAVDSHALRSVGILLAVLTLGGSALIRHWF
ncbi:collagen binding domain-containing protein [Lactiplantibacillus paraxiangfangensis]|uniref:collagen binding domain-containing protein n=1 Tax=Lactiplantibacillus paraxiangfangensis TaxID=3076224 RepID=UPI0030C73A9D